MPPRPIGLQPVKRLGGKRAGAGRPKGSGDKLPRITAKAIHDIRAMAQEHSEEAIAALVQIMKSRGEDAKARAHCAEILLAYGHGKPRQPVEHTGADGGPIEVVSVEERQRLAQAIFDEVFGTEDRGQWQN